MGKERKEASSRGEAWNCTVSSKGSSESWDEGSGYWWGDSPLQYPNQAHLASSQEPTSPYVSWG